MLVRTVKSVDWQLRQIFLTRVLFFYILYFLTDIIWILFEFGVLKNVIFHFCSNITCYIIGSVSSLYWYVYSEAVQGNKKVLLKEYREKLGIPLLIMIVISSIFFIVMEFYFHKSLRNGQYYYLITTITVLYFLLFASIKSFIRAADKNHFDNREVSLIMGIFPIVLLVGSIFQMIFLHVPLLCYFVLVDFICVYLGCLDNQVSIDSLTKLNNRNQLNRYLASSMKDKNGKKWVYFIDVDKFKYINDNFGHMEGDKALVIIANALKKCCNSGSKKYFISRYGGDEFVIFVNENDVEKPKKLKKNIENALDDINKTKVLPYKLSVSIGYSLVDFSMKSLEKSLQLADEELYREKTAKTEIIENVAKI